MTELGTSGECADNCNLSLLGNMTGRCNKTVQGRAKMECVFSVAPYWNKYLLCYQQHVKTELLIDNMVCPVVWLALESSPPPTPFLLLQMVYVCVLSQVVKCRPEVGFIFTSGTPYL